MTGDRRDRIWRSVAWTALALSVLVLIAAGLAGPGYRIELVELGTAFTLLRWGAYLGIAVGLLAVVFLVIAMAMRRKQEILPLAAAAILCGLVVFPIRAMQADAQAYPPIHDVTTDLADPPVFVAIEPRAEDPMRVPPRREELEDMSPQERWRTYHGEAYGDLRALTLDVPPREAIELARAAAEEMSWEIVDVAPEAGRLEATATTAWFGFKDDVVVRITPAENGGARVDLRSVSRIGISDLGKNAERIRAFLKTLEVRASR